MVLGTLNGRTVKFLVDTGAAVSLLSLPLATELGLREECLLPPPPLRLCGADGSDLTICGTSVVRIAVGASTCLHDIYVVRQLYHPCILGRDVLSHIPCTIQSDGAGLRFSAAESSVSTVDPTRIALRLSGRATVPPHHEVFAWAVLDDPTEDDSPLLLEPDRPLAEEHSVFVARALVNPSQGKVPVRLLNCSDHPITLRQSQHVGAAYAINAVHTAENDELTHDLWDDPPPHTQLWDALRVDHSALSADELAELQKLLSQYRDVFALSSQELGRTRLMSHSIDTGTTHPVSLPARRLPWASRETARRIVSDMLDQGVIEESTSPWSAPIVLVAKKDGSMRFCVDYRRLNDVTVKDPYPLPRVDDTLDALGGARYFSTLDLCSGYHQLPMNDADREKTAFSTPDGHYHFNVMPFGVCNGPSSFQRLMGAVLRGLQWQICLVYLDDIIVFARTFTEHLCRLRQVFSRLRSANLRLKPSKCFLFRPEVEFLGHVVSDKGVHTDPAKVAKIVSWSEPQSKPEVRAFLGFCGYYRRFVRDFASVSKPLTTLTRDDVSFSWTPQCTDAFRHLKTALSSAPVLLYPRFQPDAPRFVLDVDASGVGLGAVLSQADEEGRERPIAFASRLLSSTERRYSATKLELLGVVWAFGHFRCYLLGRPFLVRTDHRALQHLSTFKDPSAIIARWLEFLSEFTYEVNYRQGRAHANADALSRQSAPRQCVASVAEPPVPLPTPFVQRRRWAPADWAAAQSIDEDLVLFQSWLRIHPPQCLPSFNGVSPDLHAYWRARDQFFIEHGVLCRRFEDDNPCSEPLTQILVPRHLRPEILQEYHDYAGHAGVHRTCGQLRQRFHWYGLKRDAEDWVASCESCSKRKKPVHRGRGAPLQVTWAGSPFERIAMDLIPGLPETAGGNRHILVVVDYFTKWVEAYPLKRMDANTIASVFVSEFVARFGAPQSLHTDQGRNFDSAVFKEVCALLGIKKTRTTAYHPAGDGLVERFNQTLEALLSHYVASHQRDWDTQLPAMLMAYRATPQSSTGYTPAYLLFGRELCLPQDVAYGLPSADAARDEPSYVQTLRQKLAHAHSCVRKKLASVHKHQARLHDAGAVPVRFAPGDLVWLLVPAVPVGTAPKLSKLWRGPFTVRDRLSDVVYRIHTTSGSRECFQVVHVNRLKRCHVRPERLATIAEMAEDNTSTEAAGDLPSHSAAPACREWGTSATRRTMAAGPRARPPTSPSYATDATDRLYHDDVDDSIESFPEPRLMPAIPQPLPPAANAPARPYRIRRPPGHLANFVWGARF